MDLGNINIEENEINAGGINIPLIKGDQGIQGVPGIPGEPGYTPVKGTDYWTNEDKAEIISEVESEINVPTKTSDLTNDSGFIDNTVNNLTNYTLTTQTGSKIDLEINSTTYELTVKLYDKNDTLISTSTGIDLPIESMVVNASYSDGVLTLTLQNGNTLDIDISSIIGGLQPEITNSNKLSSDLVDDTNKTNKFVTTSEKNTWNAKLDASKVKTATSTTSGDVYDVTYINSMIGDIESILEELDVGGGI